MVNTKSILSRSTVATVIAAMALASAVPVLFNNSVRAVNSGGQIDNRSITMSSALYNNGTGQGQNVTYAVSFEVATAHADLNAVVVEFCDVSPIPYDTACTTPTGFDSGVTFSNLTINGGAAGTPADWVASNPDSGNSNSIAIRDGTDTSNDALLAGEVVTFNITDVDNPTLGNYAFYARIYTYGVQAGATGYTLANPDAGATAVDVGGIALSSSNVLRITSKVQERLTFCIHTSATCTVAGTEIDTTGANRITSLALGDDNGVLDPDGAFVNEEASMTIQTNALYNAVVYVKGDTLASGASQIEFSALSGTGALAASQYQNNFGNEQFGFCMETAPDLTVAAPYGDGVVNQDTTTDCNVATDNSGTAVASTALDAYYGFNTTAATAPTGSLVATKAAGPSTVTDMKFIGNISYTTQAGVYSTDLDFIATGTF